ncbi:hypothetical protein AJ80_08007 [Polytolypa hystricis UAMH7299]|uniref:Fork-head domain-containing protein n=1 Tax=Polytolypa hystricis (strain UAMH7299) TaxID=1447883 RepID=A0A2B7XE07_POLH7|nr:hypothetical protein AJ80_08007 [Polytolypa hystricis UAMH7299]
MRKMTIDNTDYVPLRSAKDLQDNPFFADTFSYEMPSVHQPSLSESALYQGNSMDGVSHLALPVSPIDFMSFETPSSHPPQYLSSNSLSPPNPWVLEIDQSSPVSTKMARHHSQAEDRHSSYLSDDFDMFTSIASSYPTDLDSFPFRSIDSPDDVPEKQSSSARQMTSVSAKRRRSDDHTASRPTSGIYPPDSPAHTMASSPCGGSMNLLHTPDRAAPDIGNLASGDEADDDPIPSDEPYAILISKALQSVPGHKMALRDIYEWFEKNTNKAKNTESKGWQNSIRHNLSMNAAFTAFRDPSSPGGHSRKSGNVWSLTPEALHNGVQSTTRYRKPGPTRKCAMSDQSARRRQQSGAKGGKATKKAAKMRHAAQGSPKDHHFPSATSLGHRSHNDTAMVHAVSHDYSQMISTAIPRIDLMDSYALDDVIGCTSLPGHPSVFYHEADIDTQNLTPEIFPVG